MKVSEMLQIFHKKFSSQFGQIYQNYFGHLQDETKKF